LEEARQVAENELRTEAKKQGASYFDETIDVEYTMPQHRYLSPQIIREMVPAKILDALGIITRVEQVDEKVLKAVVKAGKIPKMVLTKALVEESTEAPRVTIKIKEQHGHQR
jgi:hypothetical protein